LARNPDDQITGLKLLIDTLNSFHLDDILIPGGFMKNLCAIEGCNRLVQTREWCQKHYHRWWKHGDPTIDRIKMRYPKNRKSSGISNNWKGGRWQRNDGYIWVHRPDHPNNRKGYVLEHRLVLETQLGRLLLPSEIAHHINGVRDDNRPENLEVMTRSTHMKLHKKGASRDVLGRFHVHPSMSLK
jgi:hypothetical protein